MPLMNIIVFKKESQILIIQLEPLTKNTKGGSPINQMTAEMKLVGDFN